MLSRDISFYMIVYTLTLIFHSDFNRSDFFTVFHVFSFLRVSQVPVLVPELGINNSKPCNINVVGDSNQWKKQTTRGYQKVLSLTWKEPEIWIYSALFFNVVPFQLHTLVPSSFPVINTRSVEVNILVP